MTTTAAPVLLKPRRYQTEAMEAVEAAISRGVTRPAVVLPTGFGKTVVFSHMIARNYDAGKRTLVMVHREELAEQAKDKVKMVAPHLTVGIVKAERNEVKADVIVASVQTLARQARREQIDPASIGMVIVDECHHAVARTWMQVIEYLDAPTVGFTATLTRNDGLGLGDVWQEVVYERDILYGIDNGYLTDVRGEQVTVDGLDLATVARSRGDYQEGKLGEALEASGAGEIIAEAYKEHAGSRRGLLFCPTVATAVSFAKSMNDAGIVTEVITGDTPSEIRREVYARFASGATQVLSNCMVLTEGFDAPWAEVAVIARPTQSAALYTQMVGRVLRPWQGKDEALVLDVVGIAGNHKLRSLTDLVKTEVKPGETITEARERIEAEAGERMERIRIQGERKSREVELFASSHAVWLQTRKGTWFIPTRDRLFVLWADADGTYRVGQKATGPTARNADPALRKGEWLRHGLTIEYAMAWGEQLATDIDPTIASRDRSWRRQRPSQAQVDLATRVKVLDADEVTEIRRGELSDRLSIFFASKELDRK